MNMRSLPWSVIWPISQAWRDPYRLRKELHWRRSIGTFIRHSRQNVVFRNQR